MHDHDDDHDHPHGHAHHHGHVHVGDDHDHDLADANERLEDNPLWISDHITLKSVGIDIGSSGTQVMFSEIKLRRMGEDLSSRYFVVSRESLYRSPVALTPYINAEQIDDKKLGVIIADAYRESGFGAKDVDTGVVILTGEAMRRENARAIADMLAADGGEFVCATAGHNMEARLAAFGSGAAAESFRRGQRLLNVDIGGGTTKFAVVENGRVIETAALYVGGRLVVVDPDNRVVRLDPGGEQLAALSGISCALGEIISPERFKRLADWMAAAIFSAAQTRPLPAEIEGLFLTRPMQSLNEIAGVIFSGGVAEYIYGHEDRDFGDLGKLLGLALRRGMQSGACAWPFLPAGECIRATVVGASEYSVQVSGNTIYISRPAMLPRRNLQVLRPPVEMGATIDAAALANAIQEHFRAFDLVEGEAEAALAFHWTGMPSYERISTFAAGLVQGLRRTIERRKPMIVVLDGDVAQTLGAILHEEHEVDCDVLVVDGISLQDFDYIDIGRMLEPSHTVPVTIKSLLFN
jgi:ethanolamine utilization protein EutA